MGGGGMSWKQAQTSFSWLQTCFLTNDEAAYYAQHYVLSKLELRKTLPGGWVGLGGCVWLEQLKIEPAQLHLSSDLG